MHPTNRAERRAQRDRLIARRRFIYTRIWNNTASDTNDETNIYARYYGILNTFSEWGRYAKWNLGCGCKGCHREKYYSVKSKRRKLRKNSFSTAECRNGDRKIKE